MIRRDNAVVAQRKCLRECFSRIGVEIKEVHLNRVIRAEDPAFRGRPFLFEEGWIADFPDPDNFLRPLFYSTSPANPSGYQNAEVDRLLDQAWTETSYSTRNRLYRKAEKLILMDSPLIPIFYGNLRYLLRPNVKGFTISPMGESYINVKQVWLSDDEKLSETDL